MATYKVIQDIEAEDKLLGPLTLRQFIYAIIAVVSAFLGFKMAAAKWFLVFPFLPPAIFFGVLAAPFGHDQSSEVWLLAKIRFILKPRRRIWDQSGLKQLVTVTAPKRVEKHLTDGLSQTEVESRLKALANTLDSRGWAIKNVNVNLFSEPSYLNQGSSDRLIDVASLPQDAPATDVDPADDIMDATSNPTAHHFDQMIAAAAQAHRQQVVQTMQTPAAPAPGQSQTASLPADYWFMNQPAGSPSPAAEPTTDEQALAAQIKAQHSQPDPTYAHMRRIPEPGEEAAKASSTPVTTPVDPVILDLANNDDLNVATIARQAQKKRPSASDDEVVVSLH